MLVRTLVSAAVLASVAPHVAAETHGRASLSIEERQQLDNTYIFRFSDSVTRGNERGRASELVSGAGGQIRFVYQNAYRGFAATVPPQAVARIANARGIDSYTKDQRVDASAKPPWAGGGGGETSGQVLPWGIDRMNAENNGAIDFAGYKAYIIDSGIDTNHNDLNVSTNGFAAVTCKGNKGKCKKPWDDDNSHGTHVAGTIGAIDNDKDVVGVAPGVELVAVKVLSNSGSGSWAGVIAGIDWVAGQNHGSGAVANMSLGGGGGDGGPCNWSGTSDTGKALKDAICEATKSGVIFVVAAGNETDDAGNHSPAAYDSTLVTVSSTDGDASAECASGSKDGWSYFSNYGDDVEIGAPGSSILSTIPGSTGTKSGTSMASPHVAGAAVVWLEANTVYDDERNFQNFETAIHSGGAWDEPSSGSCWDSETRHPEGLINTP